MTKKIRDRYFVINHYQGKNGPRSHVFPEYPSHDAAIEAAYLFYTELEHLTGRKEDETFEVFVGSKTTLDRKLGKNTYREPK